MDVWKVTLFGCMLCLVLSQRGSYAQEDPDSTEPDGNNGGDGDNAGTGDGDTTGEDGTTEGPYSFGQCTDDGNECSVYPNTVCSIGNQCICNAADGYYVHFDRSGCELSLGTCVPSSEVEQCTDVKHTYCSADGQCLCNDQNGFETSGGGCVRPTELQKLCDVEDSRCTTANSACQPDGMNQGTNRCLCSDGYTAYESESDSGVMEMTCVKTLTRIQNESCTTCENNEGICLDMDEDGAKDGCKCKISRSGDDCELSHVNVTCTMEQFRMVICYLRNEGVNFTEGASLSVQGFGNVPACVARTATDSFEFCNGSIYDAELILSLHPGDIDQCGTKMYPSGLDQVKYISTIMIRLHDDDITSDDIMLNTYCSYNSYKSTSFAGFGVIAGPGNGRGQSLDPDLEFLLVNSLGQTIPPGVALKLGDQIRLQLLLRTNGVYKSIKVMNCMASSSAYIPDSAAATVPLLVNECPVNGSVLSQFQRVLGEVFHLQSELMPVFRLRTGNVIFIHCKVMLCFDGEEADCELTDCRAGDAEASRRRRKRQANSPPTSRNISREIIVYEDQKPGEVVMDKAMFGVMIGVLAALLVIFTIAAGVMFIKLRKYQDGSHKNDEVNLTHKPQRFTMPRIQRPTMRI